VPQLFDEICRLVAEGHYLIGDHAWERLLERGIMEWQVIAGMAEARLIAERRLARPNPIVEMRLPLPNGDDCKVVWSLLRRDAKCTNTLSKAISPGSRPRARSTSSSMPREEGDAHDPVSAK
jgi:hypothetical protein